MISDRRGLEQPIAGTFSHIRRRLLVARNHAVQSAPKPEMDNWGVNKANEAK